MSGLNKEYIVFDPADAAGSDNIGAFVRAGDDGTLIGHVSDALKVNLSNASIAVTATDLDIRDLDAAQDNVAISDGTDVLAIEADGSINVNATIGGTHAEDAAHVSGDIGMFALAIRNDGAATSLTSADGDYSGIAVDEFGRVFVNAEFTSTADFVYAEDSAAVSGDQLAAVAAVRQDTLASSVSADGDYGTLKLNAAGALWVAPVGNVADDAADAGSPIKVGSRAVSGALAAVSATGDRADLLSDLYRRVWINDSPNIGVASAAVSVDTTVGGIALPASALAGRRRMIIQNNSSSQDVFVGPTGVTAASGLIVPKKGSLALEIGENVALFGITSASSANVRVFQLA
jgi:hypothetical protein